MTYPGSSWTDARVEQLRKLCADGLSASQMAEELGGLSRNAVIRKIHRSGMVFGSMSVGGRPKKGRKPRTHPFVERKAKTTDFIDDIATDLPPEPVANPVTLLELEWHHCRYVVSGDAVPAMFCGATVKPGHSWCSKHCRIVYAPSMSSSRGERELMIRRMAKMRGAKAA